MAAALRATFRADLQKYCLFSGRVLPSLQLQKRREQEKVVCALANGGNQLAEISLRGAAVAHLAMARVDHQEQHLPGYKYQDRVLDIVAGEAASDISIARTHGGDALRRRDLPEDICVPRAYI